MIYTYLRPTHHGVFKIYTILRLLPEYGFSILHTYYIIFTFLKRIIRKQYE